MTRVPDPGNVSPLDDPVPDALEQADTRRLSHKVAANGDPAIGHKRGRERYDRRGDAAGTFAGSVLLAFGFVKFLPAPGWHCPGGFVDH
jgi:hypothetical protein